MKTKGRRQSKNVRTEHPTDGYKTSGTYRQGMRKQYAREEEAIVKDTRPGVKAVAKAEQRIKDESRIKREAARRGERITSGKRKGPRVGR
jgi:hypothetical protein